MKKLLLIISLFFVSAAQADSALEYQKSSLLKDRQEYIENKCIMNSVSLWFVHTCKDIAWEAGKILDQKGYTFTSSRVDLALGGPMKSVVLGGKITSDSNSDLNLDINPRELVGKVVAHNATDISGSTYLVISLVTPDLDLATVSSTRIGKQGSSKDLFCKNSYIASRKYLSDLKKLAPCKTVAELNDL